MKKSLHILFIAIFAYSAFLHGMENPIQIHATHYAPPLPLEIMVQIASYCRPTQKNILMKLRKDFYACLKNRELIVCANPSTVSVFDKGKDMFKYTYANNIDMMRFLLENGIKADIKNVLDMTLFHIASDNISEPAMQLLIDHGADKNALKPQVHALHEAVYKGKEEAVKIFLKLKIKPDLALANGMTPLHIASHEGHTDIVESLLYAGANIELATTTGWTPLLIASQYGHFDTVQLLLHVQAKVNYANNNGRTPLLTASRYGHTEIVELLIDEKAQVNHANNDGWTPLLVASRHGHTEIVKLLIGEKANVSYADKDGWTPLLSASRYGNTEIVKLLIDEKADVNHADKKGWTPLCAASYYNNIEIVQLLLDNGADIHAKLTADSTSDPIIKAGDTALQIAQKKCHTEVEVNILLHMAQDNLQIIEFLHKRLQKEKESI